MSACCDSVRLDETARVSPLLRTCIAACCKANKWQASWSLLQAPQVGKESKNMHARGAKAGTLLRSTTIVSDPIFFQYHFGLVRLFTFIQAPWRRTV
eukprot:2222913-Amphidinium_carterae.1